MLVLVLGMARACFKNRLTARDSSPQGLKPGFYAARNGTAEAVPFQNTIFETSSMQIFMIPHYLAPFTAAFYALGLQAMRHLRLASGDGRPFGIGFVRFMVTICVLLAGVRAFAQPLHYLEIPVWLPSTWLCSWSGPMGFGKERAQVKNELEHLPGKQLVIVRYPADHYVLDEWVANAPDIDRAKVIWAREMDAADHRELIRYYQGRHVWLVQPDIRPVKISPYPEAEQAQAGKTP
jgi:hypothetical protein